MHLRLDYCNNSSNNKDLIGLMATLFVDGRKDRLQQAVPRVLDVLAVVAGLINNTFKFYK